MAENAAHYEITADPGIFTRAMNAVARSAKETSAQVNASFQALRSGSSNLMGSMQTLTGVIAGLTAMVAGGAAFKGIIESQSEWVGETNKLAGALGLSTEKASVYLLAAKRAGIEIDQIAEASAKLAEKLGSNSKAFEVLGITVRDVNGQYRPAADLMGEVNEKLMAITNPMEQSIAGMQLYGESWNQMKGILKLTTPALTDAEQRAKALGLVVGQENVAAVKEYKLALNDMKLVTASLETQVGAVLLPRFAQMGAWLANYGPSAGRLFGGAIDGVINIISVLGSVVMEVARVITTGWGNVGEIISSVFGHDAPSAMQVFLNMLKIIEIACIGFRTVIMTVFNMVIALIDNAVAEIARLAKVAERAMHGDFSGAKQAWEDGAKDVEAVNQRSFDRIVDNARSAREQINNVIARGHKASPEITQKHTPSDSPQYKFNDSEKSKSRMTAWEERLALDRDGYEKQQQQAGTAQEYGKERERDYWKKLLDTVKMSQEERTGVMRKYLSLEQVLRKEAFESELAADNAKLEGIKNNHEQRLTLLTDMANRTAHMYGEQSKQAIDARAKINAEQLRGAEQVRAINQVQTDSANATALSRIDFAEKEADQQVALGQLTKDRLLEMQAQFEADRIAIRRAAIEQEQAELQSSGADTDPVAIAKLHAKREELEAAHQARMQQIRHAVVLEQRADQMQLFQTVQQGWAQVIAQTLQGSLKMSDILRNMLRVVLNAIISMLAQMLAKWLINLALGQAASKVSAISGVISNAGVAGAAATASAAAIPVIGWEIAPAAGAAASAAAMGYLSLASAKGGYSIPAFENPIVQVHEQEMILPAPYANVIRNLAGNGAEPDSSAQAPVIHYNDHSGRLTDDDIRRKAAIIARVLQDHQKR
ncbi:hypothetical protein V8J88_03840 [Massilia sp. W12]|uniref:hypothetical protein n=1 Tax=Massilia sp. W12 TaxID=3126507 RepID=UPI0030D07940